jgi:transcriptional regulator with XRE-family HTH domain
MVNQYDQLVGRQIAQMRVRRGMTQDQLAAKLQTNGCDLTRSAVAKIEAGQRHIYLYEFKIFCIALSCTYSDLMP